MRTGRFYESFPVTAFLLLINLAWFGLEVIQHLKYTGALPGLGGWVAIDVKVLRLLGALSWKELERGEYWRIVSCAFLHGGVIHILFNGLMLSDLGRSCEPLLSRWKFLVAYGIGILGSAAGSMTGCRCPITLSELDLRDRSMSWRQKSPFSIPCLSRGPAMHGEATEGK